MQTVVSSCGRQGSADFRRNRIGGSAWESNPPGMGLPPHNGFEVLCESSRSVTLSPISYLKRLTFVPSCNVLAARFTPVPLANGGQGA